jgi:hypothetical protein
MRDLPSFLTPYWTLKRLALMFASTSLLAVAILGNGKVRSRVKRSGGWKRKKQRRNAVDLDNLQTVNLALAFNLIYTVLPNLRYVSATTSTL